MASLLRKYNISVYDNISIKNAMELIENIEPHELKVYLNNYYSLGVKRYDNDEEGENLKAKIKEYIGNYNLEKDVKILNDLEENMNELLVSLKTKENKPNLTTTLTTLTTLINNLSYYILGLQRLKKKNTSFLGGGKYKMHSKKEILGKMRCIYKKEGDRKDRKEYIKHKGNFITLRKFREYNKQKK